jgi:tyrosyl-tRNA synthetase
MDHIEELLTRGVANIIPSREELKKVLNSKKKLNIYLGIDPTATQIHLGHAVALRMLNKFSKLGHNVTFLIGDFTALIGDTSDKDKERPILTPEQIKENFQTYKKQAEKVLDFSKVHVRHNSEWLNKLSFPDIVKLTQQFSFGDFASRELIKKRLEEGKRVGLHEGLYPTMQGYDSFFMDTDVQIGGTDQTFNMQAGRILQKNWRDKESFIIANEFLMGTDGRKMSKTWGNAIWLNDNPNDMFAKVMAINDDLISSYLTLGTNITTEEIKAFETQIKQNPMKAKKQLAKIIVTDLHNAEQAADAEKHFEKTVQHNELTEDIPVYLQSMKKQRSIIDLLVAAKLTTSKSEAKRLIEQKGVSIDNKTIDINQKGNIKEGSIIKVGKRKIVKIKFN